MNIFQKAALIDELVRSIGIGDIRGLIDGSLITAPAALHNGSRTSIAAAQSVVYRLAGDRLQIFGFIRRRGSHGATGSEIAEGLSYRLYRVRRRCTDLKRAGYIRDSGRTRLNTTGNEEIVWELTHGRNQEES